MRRVGWTLAILLMVLWVWRPQVPRAPETSAPTAAVPTVVSALTLHALTMTIRKDRRTAYSHDRSDFAGSGPWRVCSEASTVDLSASASLEDGWIGWVEQGAQHAAGPTNLLINRRRRRWRWGGLDAGAVGHVLASVEPHLAVIALEEQYRRHMSEGHELRKALQRVAKRYGFLDSNAHPYLWSNLGPPPPAFLADSDTQALLDRLRSLDQERWALAKRLLDSDRLRTRRVGAHFLMSMPEGGRWPEQEALAFEWLQHPDPYVQSLAAGSLACASKDVVEDWAPAVAAALDARPDLAERPGMRGFVGTVAEHLYWSDDVALRAEWADRAAALGVPWAADRLRHHLVVEGHVAPRTWREHLRAAAMTCAQGHPSATIRGYGHFADGSSTWVWEDPDAAWASCLDAETAASVPSTATWVQWTIKLRE